MIPEAEIRRLAGQDGVDPMVVDLDYEYGKESYQARLYYHGPLPRGGDPRAIRLDVTTHEVLELPCAHRRLAHPYSDANALGDIKIPCYHLLEVLAEKTRAMAGQRKYAISRDLYDIAQMTIRKPVSPADLAKVLPKELAVKGLFDSVLDVNPVLHRKADYRADWDRNLMHLLPPGAEMSFEDAWERTVDFMQRVDQALRNKDQVNPCR